MLSFGSLLAHLLSQIVPWVQGLCVLNMVVLVFHFFAVGFFHPETPRYLFAVKDKKAECANALQWLRGRMADIGQEYTDLADSILIHGPANPIDASGLDLMKDRYEVYVLLGIPKYVCIFREYVSKSLIFKNGVFFNTNFSCLPIIV